MAQMGLPASVVQDVRRRIAMQLMQQKQLEQRMAQKRALDILAAQRQQAQQAQMQAAQAIQQQADPFQQALADQQRQALLDQIQDQKGGA